MECDVLPHRASGAKIVNTDTSRQLLGLPPFYVASSLDEAVAQCLSHHAGRLVAELALDLSNAATPLPDRLACGAWLAWQGDPRINALAPTMCDVPAVLASVGLNPEYLQPTYARLQHLGVEQDWIRKEVPRHTRQLAAFRIGRYQVTHEEYRQFLVATRWPRLPTSWRLGRYPRDWANHPVHGIRPEDADAYAAWLAQTVGRAFRLPTEAEWELAAAGLRGYEFPWGDHFEHLRANTAELGLLCTTPIGSFPNGASWCGALDMAGNVEEYVSECYAPYPGGDLVEDDLYRLNPGHRVARGGSFARFFDLARTRRRHGAIDANEVYIMGFRLAEDIA
jgi:toxoflavin biosynthesis protein ToxD